MNAQDALHDLWLVDQQVRGLESRLTAARRRVAAQQTKLDKLIAQRDELADRRKHELASAGDLENEADAIEEKIKHLREQMNNARTNKEYSAFLVEVNTIKANKGKLEEQALEHMAKADELKAEIDELESQIAEVETIKQSADAELAKRENEVGDDLEQIKAKRNQAAKHVQPDTLALFDRLADNYDGEALAIVEEADRRRMEYHCGGCYMQIPVENLNRLLTSEEPVRCPSCGRFLFLDKELRGSFA